MGGGWGLKKLSFSIHFGNSRYSFFIKGIFQFMISGKMMADGLNQVGLYHYNRLRFITICRQKMTGWSYIEIRTPQSIQFFLY